MFKQIFIVLAVFALTTGYSQAESTTQVSAEPGKIVVYRADERFQTKTVSYAVYVDGNSIGRLKHGKAVVTTVPAGEYTVNTRIKGSESIDLNVKAGQTYYVYSGVKRQGSAAIRHMAVVEEKVAIAQQPSIETSI